MAGPVSHPQPERQQLHPRRRPGCLYYTKPRPHSAVPWQRDMELPWSGSRVGLTAGNSPEESLLAMPSPSPPRARTPAGRVSPLFPGAWGLGQVALIQTKFPRLHRMPAAAVIPGPQRACPCFSNSGLGNPTLFASQLSFIKSQRPGKGRGEAFLPTRNKNSTPWCWALPAHCGAHGPWPHCLNSGRTAPVTQPHVLSEQVSTGPRPSQPRLRLGAWRGTPQSSCPGTESRTEGASGREGGALRLSCTASGTVF